MDEPIDLATTVATLSDRLRVVEDELAIHRLLAAYGPAVDSGSCREAAELWTEEGDQHQGIIATGSAHLTPCPVIRIDGDRAVVLGYSLVLLRDGDGFRTWRASANRWTLRRTDSGWRIAERLNRVLDGSSEPRDVLGEAVP